MKTELSKTESMTTAETFNVVVTRVFDAHVENVWKAWSEPDQVKKWWGPKGFTTPLAEMNFREGGTSLVCMRAPQEYGGQDFYNTWTYKRIIPKERIEFVLNFTDKDWNKLDPAKMGMPPGIPIDVLHVITFATLQNGKTEMTVTEYGYTTIQSHDISKAGLEQCLDKMEASFEK